LQKKLQHFGKILFLKSTNKWTKCTADNSGLPSALLRGGASGDVCPQTVLWEFGSLSPAGTFVPPACVKPPPRYLQADGMCSRKTNEKKK
jgi:hypothetical protein